MHASTHARPGLPINQTPNLTPAGEYASALHDTAAGFIGLAPDVDSLADYLAAQSSDTF